MGYVFRLTEPNGSESIGNSIMIKYLREFFSTTKPSGSSKDYYQTTEVVEDNEQKEEEVVLDISEPVISVGKLLQEYPWENVREEDKDDLDLSRNVWYYHYVRARSHGLVTFLTYKDLAISYYSGPFGGECISIKSSNALLNCKDEEVKYLAKIINSILRELLNREKEAARFMLTYIAQEYLSEQCVGIHDRA